MSIKFLSHYTFVKRNKGDNKNSFTAINKDGLKILSKENYANQLDNFAIDI